MASNNPRLANAVIAGAAGLLYDYRKGAGALSTQYTTLATRVSAIAVQVDAAISAITTNGGPNTAQIAILTAISQRIFNDPATNLVSSSYYDEIATVIAAEFAATNALLEWAPTMTGSGVSGQTITTGIDGIVCGTNLCCTKVGTKLVIFYQA
jgi:hypothetical protein